MPTKLGSTRKKIASSFKESEHPRYPPGHPLGGQFMPKGGDKTKKSTTKSTKKTETKASTTKNTTSKTSTVSSNNADNDLKGMKLATLKKVAAEYGVKAKDGRKTDSWREAIEEARSKKSILPTTSTKTHPKPETSSILKQKTKLDTLKSKLDEISKIGKPIAQDVKDVKKTLFADELPSKTKKTVLKEKVSKLLNNDEIPKRQKTEIKKAVEVSLESSSKSIKSSPKEIISIGATLSNKHLDSIKDHGKKLVDISIKLRNEKKRLPKASVKDRKNIQKNIENLQQEQEKLKKEQEQAFINLREDLGKSTPLSKQEARALAEKVDIDIKDPQIKQRVLDDLTDYYYHTGGKGQSLLQSIKAEGDRAYADKNKKLIEVGKNAPSYALWHEVSHHAETENKNILRANEKWREERSLTQNAEKLNDITNSSKYRNDEIAYRGNYITPYVGRVYTSDVEATEVHAVGMEHFHSPQTMRSLYNKDPEHFNLVLGHLLNN
jgi:hypothetical protein